MAPPSTVRFATPLIGVPPVTVRVEPELKVIVPPPAPPVVLKPSMVRSGIVSFWFWVIVVVPPLGKKKGSFVGPGAPLL